jgi:uncharacterized phage protein (TIGR02220 family)
MVIQNQQEAGDIEDMRKSCVIYDSWADQIINLPLEMAGEYVQNILRYAIYEEDVQFENPALYAMFVPVKKRLDEDRIKYQEKVDRVKTNSERNRNEIDTKSERNRNEIAGDNDNVNDNVNDSKDKDIMSDQVSEIVDYLNEKLGTRYKKSKSTTSQIKARLEEGHTVDDFKTVIDKKVRSWKDDPKMSQYLRPETLFRPSHFESYLNEIETGRASPKPKTDMTSEMYSKIHNFGYERKIDYEVLGAEFANL